MSYTCGFRLLFSCAVFLLAVTVRASQTQPADLTALGEERDTARMKKVEQQFVTDTDKLLQKYKKEYGGGNYNIELMTDLFRQTSAHGLKPVSAMLKCREQYMVTLATVKREKEHTLFYCLDGNVPVQSGFYTKQRSGWKTGK
jgi:hypothetical protein